MKKPGSYLHRVQYYETDRMGIVHHSNHIRWMEEARLEYMRLNGVDYTEIEAAGIMMPVLGVSCSYKRSACFGDVAELAVRLLSFNGVRAVFAYRICLAGSDDLLAVGESEHCFIDGQTRKPVNLKKRMPELSGIIISLLESENK